ncbi:MAG TPA: hypothetical protein VLI43_09595 [Gemmatimonadaceae bacterium]|nr:hypothetical protein [Gemmatimonadaceae bacterium]
MNELYIAREANEWTARLRHAAPFVVIGTGIAQVALGLGQSLLATTIPARTTIVAELVAFNAGCVPIGLVLAHLRAS